MIFTGNSEDGSDAYPMEGMYFNKNETVFSNMPFTREQKAYSIVYKHGFRYKKSFIDIYKDVKNGSKECLPLWCRQWLINEFKKQSV
mgnify:CR=1 FL=1